MNSRMPSLTVTSRRIARVAVTCASLLLIGQIASAQTCSPPGLVAWWPGEGSAVDVTGSHNGTLVCGGTFAPGIVGSAFKTDCFRVPDSPSLNPTNAITVEAWINPAPGQGGVPSIFRKTDSNYSGYALEMDGYSNRIGFDVFVHGAAWARVGNGITTEQWSHVAGVYDGRNVMLYINGVLAASTPIAGTIEPSSEDLNIGFNPERGQAYVGLIDEPAIFHRALAPSEIAAIYTSGANGHCGSQTTGVVIHSYSVTSNTIGTLSASLFKDAKPLAGKPLEFLVQGASAGIGTTDAAGLATVAQPPSLNAGFYPGALEVRFAGDGDLASQTARADLLVYQYPSTITWPQPAPGAEGTALSVAQLNATVDAPGSLVYDQPVGTLLALGITQVCVTFTPDDPVNYTGAATCVNLTVNVVTPSSHPAIVGRIETAGQYDVAIDSTRGIAYAADGSLAIIDGATSAVRGSIPLQMDGIVGAAAAIALDPTANRLYVTDSNQPRLWVVDGDRKVVVNYLPLPRFGGWVSFNPANGLVYVADIEDNVVRVVDPALIDPQRADVSLVSTISVSCVPGRMAVNPATNLIYVGCDWNGEGADVIDSDRGHASFNSVVAHLIADRPALVAVDRRTNRVYLARVDWYTNRSNVAVFDGNPSSAMFNQLLGTVDLGTHQPDLEGFFWPRGIAVNSTTGMVYVKLNDTNGGAGFSTVTAIDGTSGTVASVTMLPFEDHAWTDGLVSVDATTNRIYVTNGWSVATVLQDVTTTTVGTAAAGVQPVTLETPQVSVAFAQVASSGQTTIQQVDASQVTAQVPGQFSLSGALAYEISTTASVTAPILLCFNASSVTDPATFATLAVLHGENGGLVDRTVSRDFATGTICASVASLSPFVIARRIGPAYHLQPLYDVAKSGTAGSTIPVRVRLVDASGRNVSAANVTLKAVSITPTAGGSPGPVNDAGRSNPNGFFRFDPTLGGYVFNLSTRGLTTGSYQLSIEGPDKPLRYAVAIQIR